MHKNDQVEFVFGRHQSKEEVLLIAVSSESL